MIAFKPKHTFLKLNIFFYCVLLSNSQINNNFMIRKEELLIIGRKIYRQCVSSDTK